MRVWNQGLSLKQQGKYEDDLLNVYMRIVHVLIQLNKLDHNPPEITLYNFI